MSVAIQMGYEVLARNFRVGRLEGDLLLRGGNQLWIWEVRGRSGRSYPPSQSLSWKKLKCLARLARSVQKRTGEAVRVQLFEWRGSLQEHEWRLFDIDLSC